jgi:hypothetical protein
MVFFFSRIDRQGQHALQQGIEIVELLSRRVRRRNRHDSSFNSFQLSAVKLSAYSFQRSAFNGQL